MKYMLHGVQLEGVDSAAIRVTHLMLRPPTVCVLLVFVDNISFPGLWLAGGNLEQKS